MPNQRHIWPFRIPSARREVQLIQQTSSWSGTSLIPPRRASSPFLLSHQGSKAPTLPDSCSGSSPAPWARAWAHTPSPGHCSSLPRGSGRAAGTGPDGTGPPSHPPLPGAAGLRPQRRKADWNAVRVNPSSLFGWFHSNGAWITPGRLISLARRAVLPNNTL